MHNGSIHVLTDLSDEHQRRSPECLFFTFSVDKSKAGRAKKGRASTVSRLSTQSNFTALSEGASVAESEGNPDDSLMSHADAAKLAKPAKSGKGGKRATRSRKASGKVKAKAAKAKQEESQIDSSFMEPEDDNFEVKVAQAPASERKNKKRKSEEISGDTETVSHPLIKERIVEDQPPPTKRRATRARTSVALQAPELPGTALHDEREVDTYMIDHDDVPPPSAPAPKKKGNGSKKRASSNARKASTASTASKASLRAAVPNDEDIDAALEADLGRPLTDEEGDTEPTVVVQPKSRRLTRSKPGSKKATASIASTRRGTRASSVTVDHTPATDLYPSIPHISDDEQELVESESADVAAAEEHVEPSPNVKSAKGKVSRKVSKQQPNQEQPIAEPKEVNIVSDEPRHQDAAEIAESAQRGSRQISQQLPARRTRASNIPFAKGPVDVISDVDSSVLGTQTAQDDSGHETDASVIKQGRAKRGIKKAPGGVKTSKAAKKSATASGNIEEIVVQQDDQPNVVVHVAPSTNDNTQHVSIDIEIPKEQTKGTKATARATRAKKSAPKSKTKSSKVPEVSSPPQPNGTAGTGDEHRDSLPPSVHSTPRQALSPQSSDAENQPPSSRPSSLRPPLSMQSPMRSQVVRVPLALTTPVASPSRGNFSKLQSTFPWTAVDLEQIFRGSPSPNKENSPFVFGKASGEAGCSLTSPEKKLSVEQWIQFNAQRGEEKLRNECERLVGKFESQGMGALKTLEGIVAAE